MPNCFIFHSNSYLPAVLTVKMLLFDSRTLCILLSFGSLGGKFEENYAFLTFFPREKFQLIKFSLSIALARPNLVSDISEMASKVLVGINLTALYSLSCGKRKPPIDQDVTFWCAMP